MSTSGSRANSKGVTRAPRVAHEASVRELASAGAQARGMPSMSANAFHQNWTSERIEARIAQIERQDATQPQGAPTSRPAWEAARNTLREALAAERSGDTVRAATLARQASEELGTAQRAYAAIHAGRAAMRSIEGLAANRAGSNRTSPLFPSANKSLNATEQRLIAQSARDLHEFGALLRAGAEGKTLAEREGTAHAVRVPTSSARDSSLIFTHSHPTRSSDVAFSKADIQIASERGFAGIRAVTPGGVTFTMAPHSGQAWPSWSKVIEPVFDQNVRLYQSALSPLARSGRLSLERLGMLGVHLAWRNTARELGLIYSRQRNRR